MHSKVGMAELLDDFYSVFSINMRALGTPVYSKSFFANILSEFYDKTWISTVYTSDGIPVVPFWMLIALGANILLAFNSLCYSVALVMQIAFYIFALAGMYLCIAT